MSHLQRAIDLLQVTAQTAELALTKDDDSSSSISVNGDLTQPVQYELTRKYQPPATENSKRVIDKKPPTIRLTIPAKDRPHEITPFDLLAPIVKDVAIYRLSIEAPAPTTGELSKEAGQQPGANRSPVMTFAEKIGSSFGSATAMARFRRAAVRHSDLLSLFGDVILKSVLRDAIARPLKTNPYGFGD